MSTQERIKKLAADIAALKAELEDGLHFAKNAHYAAQHAHKCATTPEAERETQDAVRETGAKVYFYQRALRHLSNENELKYASFSVEGDE